MLTQSVTKTQYKVSDFLSWQKSGLLILSPKFQRRSVWRPGAKSYLLDTIVKGYPIPIIFLREQKTDLTTLQHKREVVDGQQRIRTVLSFIDPSSLGGQYKPDKDKFEIKKAHNKEIAGKSFDELSADIRQSILDYEFSVQVLPSSIDDPQVIQIFARMNATGYKLNGQELRNARFFGEFKSSMYQLAAEQLKRWENWKIYSWDNIARMEEVEITSEFAQLMLNGIVGRSQRTLDKLYESRDVDYSEKSEVERRFQAVMDLIDDNMSAELPKTIFRKRPLFYALFAAIYDRVYGIGSKLKRKKARRLPGGLGDKLASVSEQIGSGHGPEDVMKALERRTTHPSSRKTVTNYLKKSLKLG
ncbi:MAG: DUF262 domain-containing protein [Candidatus Acidiferrales bacterium]